jgi:glycosyltransferase involved in cell wall biosynthesis
MAGTGADNINAGRVVYFGRRMALEGRIPLALEALGMGVQIDISQGINLFSDLKSVEIVSRTYEELSLQTREWARVGEIASPKVEGKTRIAYVQSNLVDDTNAQTQRLLGLLKYRDRDKYDVRVYSSEDFAGRTYPLFWISQDMPGSLRRGPKFLKWCETEGIGTYIAPLEGTLLDTAYELAHSILDFKPHIVVYQGTIACPLLCLLAGWRLAPVQVSLNTGVPMCVSGLDHTFYYSDTSRVNDAKLWPSGRGAISTMPTGIDLDVCVPPVPAGMPTKDSPDQVVLMTVSNAASKRLSEEFLGAMCRTLLKRPKALYYIIGDSLTGKQQAILNRSGVGPRIAFIGCNPDVRSLLHLADIYVNEFPVGGAQSVMEAMATGLPVVAAHYSDKHQHHCGAGYVGEKWAIKPFSVEAYEAQLLQLIDDPNFRKECGDDMLNRAKTVYDYKVVTPQYETMYDSLLREKAGT